jgi:hypothetical protein
MKRLTYFVVILALIYAGYWAVGSYAVANAVQTQFQKMKNEGWNVEYTTLKTRGFPSRFDTTATELSISTPDRSISYAAPILQVLALSYQPNRVIVAFPSEQTLKIGNLPITINSDGLRASVALKPNTALSLDALTAEVKRIDFSMAAVNDFSMTNGLLAIRESTLTTNTYDTYFNLSDINLPAVVMADLSLGDMLPATIETATIDASISFDRPLDRHTLSAWSHDPGQLRGLKLQSTTFQWGNFTISADGAFTVDETGTPDGTITVTANDWKGILAVAQSAGQIPDQYRFMAQSMGQTLSQGSDTLTLPITVSNGSLSVGPLPLGPSPRFQ